MTCSSYQVLYNESLLSIIYKFSGEVTILNINPHINKIKKNILIIHLDRIKSFQYYEDEGYRVFINSLVKDTKTQLNIHLEFKCLRNKNFNVYDNGLKNLKNLNYLDLTNNEHISDANALYTCRFLILRKCRSISNVNSLGSLHYLDLSYCGLVTNISMLGNLDTLILIGCLGIEDFSLLGRVRHLNLSNTKINNTNDLGNVNILILNDCKNLDDISSLMMNKQLKEVAIIGNKNISDVSSLCNVPTVRIGGIPKLIDISALKQINKLVIMDCDLITDITSLSKIPKLKLINLVNLLDISSLGDHDELLIYKCGHNLEQAQFRQVTHLSKVRNWLVIGIEMVRHDTNIINFLRGKVKDFEVLNI